MPTENFYEQYVTELLKKANLTEEDGQIDQEYVKKLAAELEKKMGLMVFSELNQNDLEEYTKLVDKKTPADQLGKFFLDNIKSFEDKRQKVLEDFALGIFQRTATIRKSLST